MSQATEGMIHVESWRVECGDVLEVLARVPDRSVQCCVTSPPYWGLRDYGIEPSVWGGDATCQHEFMEAEWDRAKWTNAVNGRGEVQGTTAEFMASKRATSTAGFCARCGAWRGCFGLEPTPELFIEHAVTIFREVRRVLRDDGTLWLNIGDSYNAYNRRVSSRSWSRSNVWLNIGDSYNAYNGNAGPGSGFSRGAACDTQRPKLASGHGLRTKGLKPKDLIGIPWQLAFALRADGWYLRSEIIWHKRAPMPESVRDRPTKAHEQIFLLTKSPRYFYDAVASAEPAVGGTPGNREGHHKYEAAYAQGDERLRTKAGFSKITAVATRNQRSVWSLSAEPFAGAHFATFPTEIPRRCLLAGTSERGCCAACGAPWRRVVEKKRTFESGSGRAGNVPCGKHGSKWQGGGETIDVRRGPVTQVETIGWKPGCACESVEPVPCLVLDPFNGAGTTGLVARRMGLRYLGIERSPENVRMSVDRIVDDAPLLNGGRD